MFSALSRQIGRPELEPLARAYLSIVIMIDDHLLGYLRLCP